MKDFNWLKREVHKELEAWCGVEGGIDGDGINEIMLLINQLDEPEVLSDKWIDDNSIYASSDGITEEYVHVDDLQNLLVPKQEITEEQAWEKISEYYPVKQTGLKNAFEHFYYGGFMTDVVAKKPVIPKFVANYIQEGKDLGCDLGTAMTVQTELLKGIRDYIKNNEETFARAWLDGFTVEKEQKYYARIKGWENVTTGSEAFNWVYFKENDTVGISKAVENKYQAVSFTKYDWDNLGINENNADFVLVEEVEA